MLEPAVTDFQMNPSPLTRPYWDAAREGRLIFQRCAGCARPFFRPEIACPHCGSRAWAWEDSGGGASLYSFSVMHRAPAPGFKVPFVFAAVDVDEGWSMFSHVVGVELEQVRIGMRLRAVFHKVSEHLTAPMFAPA